MYPCTQRARTHVITVNITTKSHSKRKESSPKSRNYYNHSYSSYSPIRIKDVLCFKGCLKLSGAEALKTKCMSIAEIGRA
jgi:hypothetical protein